MRKQAVLSLFTLLLLANGPLHAEGEHEHGHEIGFHAPHHLSVLSADTHIRGIGDYTTLGIDYEYRVSNLLGVGFVLEHAFGELDATTAIAVADIHLDSGLILQLGPGYEHVEGENVFVTRLGMLYEFEFDGFTLSPQLHWDYHDGHENALVAGIALGFSF